MALSRTVSHADLPQICCGPWLTTQKADSDRLSLTPASHHTQKAIRRAFVNLKGKVEE